MKPEFTIVADAPAFNFSKANYNGIMDYQMDWSFRQSLEIDAAAVSRFTNVMLNTLAEFLHRVVIFLSLHEIMLAFVI